jgi:hypothetical protein
LRGALAPLFSRLRFMASTWDNARQNGGHGIMIAARIFLYAANISNSINGGRQTANARGVWAKSAGNASNGRIQQSAGAARWAQISTPATTATARALWRQPAIGGLAAKMTSRCSQPQVNARKLQNGVVTQWLSSLSAAMLAGVSAAKAENVKTASKENRRSMKAMAWQPAKRRLKKLCGSKMKASSVS